MWVTRLTAAGVAWLGPDMIVIAGERSGAIGALSAAAMYAEGPRRNVPGFSGLVPMTRILMVERVTHAKRGPLAAGAAAEGAGACLHRTTAAAKNTKHRAAVTPSRPAPRPSVRGEPGCDR